VFVTDHAHPQQSPRTFKERDHWMRCVLAADLPPAVRNVAVRVALHLNVGTGECDPTYATLAGELGISERTIYRLIAQLEQACWIAHEGTRGRRSNQYVLLNPAKAMTGLNPGTATSGFDAANPVRPDNPTLTNSASNPDTTVADKKRRKAKRKAKEESDSRPDDDLHVKPKPTAKEIAAAFESFWRAYPKRVAKLAARKAFAAAIKRDADPKAIIAGAARYAAERSGKDSQYTKHPATWLNGGCWEDEPPPDGEAPMIDGVTGAVIPAPRARRHGGPHDHVWAKYSGGTRGERD
jgi:hypothetical protein